MSEGELKKYVEENLDKGYSSEEIKEALLNAGYEESKVDKVLTQLKSRGNGLKSFKNYFLIAVGIATVIVFLFTLYFSLFLRLDKRKGGEKDEFMKQPQKLEFSCKELGRDLAREACEICKKIKDPSKHNSCLAIVTNDSKKCELAGNQRDICYLSLALRTKKNKYCKKLNTRACQAILEENPEKYRKSSGQDLFYFYLIIKKNNLSFCNQLEGEAHINHCKALVTDREGFCNRILIKDLRERCLLGIAASSQNPSLCEGLNLSSQRREACKALAERRFDDLNCSSQEEACRTAIPYAQDSDFCLKLPQNTRDTCYETLAFVKINLISPELLALV